MSCRNTVDLTMPAMLLGRSSSESSLPDRVSGAVVFNHAFCIGYLQQQGTVERLEYHETAIW